MREKASVRDIAQFLGPRVTFHLILSFCLGFLIFAAELGFAYSILVFLSRLGFAQSIPPLLSRFFEGYGLGFATTVLIAATLFRGVTWWAQQYFAGALEYAFRYEQRMRMTRALMAGGTLSAADSISLFGEKTIASGTLIMAAQMGAVNFLLSLAYLSTLAFISLKTALITTASLLIILLPLYALYRSVKTSGHQVTRQWDNINRQLHLAFQNLFFLNVSNMLKPTQDMAETSLTSYYKNHLKFHQALSLSMVAPQIVGIIILVVTCYYSTSNNLLENALLVPYFYIFLRFVQTGAGAASRCSEVIFKWPQILESYRWWKERRPFLERISLEQRSSPAVPVEFSSTLGWKLRDVSFRYSDKSPLVIQGLNLTIEPGQATVLTGASGAGKSTLLKLLLGFLPPTEGKVQVLSAGAGEHSANLVKQSVWGAIGYVGADSYLIAGTVYENLCFGVHEKKSRDEIERCLALADCQFVHELNEGLDFRIGEGGEGLSMGQRQRLGLARALLRDPKALILDEFTANLDFESQDRVIESLKTFKNKVTLVIVSHRKELLRIADQHVDLNELHDQTRPFRSVAGGG